MGRIKWIDALKGFGIFCVTFGHLSCNFLIETHIYSFHMFLFFFLSGYLHSNCQGDFRKFISKKSKHLLVPFLLWNTLSCAVGLLLGKNGSDTLRLLFLLDGEICWNAPIWFLLQLFFAEIIFFFVDKYIPHGKLLSMPILLLLWIFVSDTNVFLKLNILPACLLFYTFGNVFHSLDGKYGKKSGQKHARVFLFAFLFLCINILFGVVLNERISFTRADFGNVLYCCLAGISGVLFYLLMFRRFRRMGSNRLLTYLGENSLIIMATQYYFFTLYDVISKKLFSASVWYYRNTLKALIVSAVTIFLVCIIVELLRKLCAKNLLLKKICICWGINLT